MAYSVGWLPVSEDHSEIHDSQTDIEVPPDPSPVLGVLVESSLILTHLFEFISFLPWDLLGLHPFVLVLAEPSHHRAVGGHGKEQKTNWHFDGIAEGSQSDNAASFEVFLRCEGEVADGERDQWSCDETTLWVAAQ